MKAEEERREKKADRGENKTGMMVRFRGAWTKCHRVSSQTENQSRDAGTANGVFTSANNTSESSDLRVESVKVNKNLVHYLGDVTAVVHLCVHDQTSLAPSSSLHRSSLSSTPS